MTVLRNLFSALALLGCNLVAAHAGNLLKNPAFAQWPDGAPCPRYWGMWEKTLKGGELVRDADTVRFTNGAQAHQLIQDVAVTGGQWYELSCLARVQVDSQFLSLAVQWRDKTYKGIAFTMELNGGYDADFQPVTKVVQAPADATTATVIIGPYCTNRREVVAEGAMWIRQVSLAPTTPPQEAETASSDQHDAAALAANLRRLNPGGNQLFGVGAATENDKLYPDTQYDGSLTAPIRLAVAGNEYGSFQLAVIPFSADLKDVTLACSPLRRSKGLIQQLLAPLAALAPASAAEPEIAADNLRWFRVGYVALAKPNPWLGLRYRHTREPDPLLPAAPFAVKAGTLAAVWVDVHLPAGTPAGVYEGRVTVTADGKTVERTLQVESYGFDIPVRSSIANEFWLTPSNWQAFYGNTLKYTPELHARHAAMLGRYRVSSFPCDWITLCPQVPIYAEPDGHFSFDWTTFDKYVQNALANGTTAFWSALSCNSGWTRYLHNPKVPVTERATGKRVELGRYLPAQEDGWVPLDKMPYRENPVYRDFLVAYVRHLKELGINDISHYELFDEAGGDRFRDMLRHHRFFRELVPDLKLLDFGVHPQQNVDGQTAVGLIDTWAPHLDVLNQPEALAAMLARRVEHGEKLWAYSCAEFRQNPSGKASHSSRYTEDNYSPFCLYFRPYIATRIHAWMAWKYQLDGFYIFMLNAVPPENAGKPPAERWPATDWSDGGEKGCGTLVYPGPDFELIPGMRLANLRDGLEDYEFFATLKNRAARLNQQRHAELLRRVTAALEVDPDIVGSVFVWTKDRARLEAKRRQLAELIRDVTRAQ